MAYIKSLVEKLNKLLKVHLQMAPEEEALAAPKRNGQLSTEPVNDVDDWGMRPGSASNFPHRRHSGNLDTSSYCCVSESMGRIICLIQRNITLLLACKMFADVLLCYRYCSGGMTRLPHVIVSQRTNWVGWVVPMREWPPSTAVLCKMDLM